MAAKLKASVGRKGKNQPEDVKTVQNLLNGFAGKVKFSKLKVDGVNNLNLEKAIGVFQTDVCCVKADSRVDPGKTTIKKLTAGPGKLEAERKAEAKEYAKTLAAEHKQTLDQIRKIAEKQASAGGLPAKAGEAIYKGMEKFAQDEWDALTGKDPQPDQFDVSKLTQVAGKVVKAAEAEVKATVKMAAKARHQALAMAQAAIAKQSKATGAAVDDLIEEVTEFADSIWDGIFGKEAGKGGANAGTMPKLGDQLGKELGKKTGEVIKEIEKRKDEEECGPSDKVPLTLTGSEEEKVNSPCFKFTAAGKSPDPKSKVLLCLNKTSTNIDITKGYSKTSVTPLFKLIDSNSLWGQKVNFFVVETTNGKPDEKTKSNVVSLRTPVAPFKGTISYTGLGADKGLKYTGNGTGRLLSYTKMNGWYFFKYGGKYEREPTMRGFDCITYVGTANKVSSGMDGRGDRLAGKLGASQVDMENKNKEECIEFFKNAGKSGTYICWWSKHCFVAVGGKVHEWSESKKGYRTVAATSYNWASNMYIRQL